MKDGSPAESNDDEFGNDKFEQVEGQTATSVPRPPVCEPVEVWPHETRTSSGTAYNNYGTTSRLSVGSRYHEIGSCLPN
ncbi:hypothetical protein M404DRAFT_649290 [Pisolithus tinctorius Marx 270]|uniref:Uncharacterized protein n=1 Tax=Pisolithus tinctorius Marx 270 TaxID=870435 RepID=A0A0C3JYN9_PISTI|nr:hypothetical protein M404DRAFT_649290 [Pisolithus tinctorius Marx 270]